MILLRSVIAVITLGSALLKEPHDLVHKASKIHKELLLLFYSGVAILSDL